MKKLLKNLLLFISLVVSHNLIQAQISGSNLVCPGYEGIVTYTCTASAGSYSWSISPNDPNVFPSGSTANIWFNTAGSHTLTVTTTSPSNTYTLAINVKQQPLVNTMATQNICSGDTTAQLLFTTNPPGLLTYWNCYTPQIGLPFSGTGDINNYPVQTLNGGSSQYGGVQVYTFLNGCRSDTVSINVTVVPQVTINAVGNQTLCDGIASSTIPITTNSTFQASWINSTPSIGCAGSGVGNIPSFTPSGAPSTATISAIVSPYGCAGDTEIFTITVVPTPTVTVGSNSPVCEGQTIDLTSTGGMTYFWAGPASFLSPSANPSIVNASLSTAGDYTLTVTDVFGCTATATTNVTISPSTNISGTVTSGATTITSGYVFLLAPSTTVNIYDTVAFTSLDASGQYLFTSVTSGNYLVKCIPDASVFPNSIGTYYGNASQWDSAMVINHDCANDFVADIELVIASLLTGPGVISGHLIEGVGYGSSRLINHVNEIMAPGGPIKGITINLLHTPSGQLQAQTISDSTGYFEFTNIAVGDYTLFVDIPGLIMDSSYIIQITPSAFVSGLNSIASVSYTNLDFIVDSSAIYITNSIGISEQKNKTHEVSVFPNPAKNSINIKADKNVGQMEVQVINSLGTVLKKEKVNSNETTLHLESISSGVYLLKVISKESISVQTLIIQN